jgi:hypothetical protein
MRVDSLSSIRRGGQTPARAPLRDPALVLHRDWGFPLARPMDESPPELPPAA